MTATSLSEPVVALDLTGRTALVTGGGSGIGLACVRRLAAAGARVVVVDRDAAAAHAAVAGIEAEAVVCDLADPEQVDALPDQVDVLVNNAGMQHVAAVAEFPPERFEALQQVMVTAPFRLIRRILPGMYTRRWGRIVNISSVHGLRASPYKSGYVAAKHALEGLSKVVALEAAPYGVTCNCVNPGYVRTPLVEGQIRAQAAQHGVPESEVVERILLARSAVKRLLEPAEVAEVVAFLCTPAAGFITGSAIVMDGGWTAH
ncbi:MAG TPA: 3-hydroxybutyrate dehydrogenase [Natronosporangium sp.]|nr:3-hydroxybutyrate dehydrogenase [Natronosporangium sp.]